MDDWGLSQTTTPAPVTPPNRTTSTAVVAVGGALVGGIIGYLMNPSFGSVAVPAVLLGGMGAAIGYYLPNANAATTTAQ
jgi:hypothetical protein